MPHSVKLKNAGLLLLLFFSYICSIFAQNQIITQKNYLYLPLIDIKNKVECDYVEIRSKNKFIQFITNNSNRYLKVFFSARKDTVQTSPIEQYKTEIEITSGTKSYYKKDWPIYQESNQLFFVLLLPSNYLKTLSTEGITEILISNKTEISFSKKESNQIKNIANFLLNH